MFWRRWHPVRAITAWTGTRTVTVIVLFLTTLPVEAIDITELQVSENGGVYRIKMATVVDVAAEYVHRVLTDYAHIHRLNPAITESDVLPSPGNGVVRVKTRILDCIFVFCVELERVEDVRELSPYEIQAVIVPSLSNLQSGKTHWKVVSNGERSQIGYKGELEPDFAIFPIIGPWLIKEKLRKEMLYSLARIECIAKIQEELDWNPHLQAASLDIDTRCNQACDFDTGRCPQ